jgi:hypothetical protein
VLKEWLERHPGGQTLFGQEEAVTRSKTKRSTSTPLTRDEAHDHFKRTLAGSKWQVLRGWHVLRHSFASNCAAKGVDLREPRKPQPPEVAQESVFPWRSVIVMMVLLKEACTWAMPSRTFLRAFFGFFGPPAAAAPEAPPAAASDFFSSAI